MSCVALNLYPSETCVFEIEGAQPSLNLAHGVGLSLAVTVTATVENDDSDRPERRPIGSTHFPVRISQGCVPHSSLRITGNKNEGRCAGRWGVNDRTSTSAQAKSWDNSPTQVVTGRRDAHLYPCDFCGVMPCVCFDVSRSRLFGLAPGLRGCAGAFRRSAQASRLLPLIRNTWQMKRSPNQWARRRTCAAPAQAVVSPRIAVSAVPKCILYGATNEILPDYSCVHCEKSQWHRRFFHVRSKIGPNMVQIKICALCAAAFSNVRRTPSGSFDRYSRSNLQETSLRGNQTERRPPVGLSSHIWPGIAGSDDGRQRASMGEKRAGA